VALRQKIEAMPSNTVEDVEAQEKLLAEAEEKTARLRCAADLLLSVEFQAVSPADKQSLHDSMAIQAGHYVEIGTIEEFRQAVRKATKGQQPFHWPLEFPEVIVKRGGFDAFVGNPPFMGGTKLQTGFGKGWREFLVERIAGGIRGIRGTADLCAYFLLRANMLVCQDGQTGIVATNTVAQGDTRLVGLEQICHHRGTIIRATSSRRWPGDASLQVAQIWLRHGHWRGETILDDAIVKGITSYFQVTSAISGSPYRLAANMRKCFAGSKVNGNGFILTREQMEALVSKDARNREVIHPYLTGDDINSSPEHKSNRYVINFIGWPLDRASAPKGYAGNVAADYPDCLAIVESHVKPERMAYEPTTAWNRKLRNEWWLFGQWRWAMSAAIAGMQSVLICPVVTKYPSFVFEVPSTVFTHKVCVFTFSGTEYFALLNSTVHGAWSHEYSSTLGDTLNYAPTSCFETFPFPVLLQALRTIGKTYYECRRGLLLSHQHGLTKCYNRFHDAKETSGDVQNLRQLHVEMDQAVAAAYGWSDLDLGHGFHQTKQGLRYTISEPARRDVLARLLKLNHERYAEEVRQGLHEKKKPRGTRRRSAGHSEDLPFESEEGALS
jgi:hypothetical protein